MKNKKVVFKTIGLIIIILGLVSTILVSPLILAFGKSGRGTMVLGHDYSVLSKNEIVAKLNNDFPFDKNIKLTNGDRVYEVKVSSLSAEIDTEKTASTLLYRRLNSGIRSYVMAFLEKKDFGLEVVWDKNKLGEEITKIADQINRPFIPTEIVYHAGKISTTVGEIGLELDKNELANQIVTDLKSYNIANTNKLPIKSIGELPNRDEEEKAIGLAQKIVSKKITFYWDNRTDELLAETSVNFVGFDNSCNLENIADYVKVFSASVKQDPRDASFKFENNKVLQFESSRDGYAIDVKKMINDICKNIVGWANDGQKEIKYDLPLITTLAKVKTNEVNDLGIKELIGRGTSSFRHSSDIRNFNVQKGSEIVNRILVAPGDTFSFIKSLGEVTLDNGFKQAYVINKGKTVLDVGGGICQVSTTLFRAMLDAGLNITDRKGHAYRVSYYEEDSKPGFDATVFIPNPDLKFVNDTSNYVLIQSFYDGVKKTLAYEIYGTNDGRKSEISNYKQWDAAPAPPDVWIDDPTLPPGKVVKDESKVPGLKTSFDWKVTRNGEILHQKTYVTNYVPWAAVYRRGPQI